MNNNYYNNRGGNMRGRPGPNMQSPMPPMQRKKLKSRFPWTELFIGILAITAVFVLVWTFVLGGNGPVGTNTDETETTHYDGGTPDTSKNTASNDGTDTEKTPTGAENNKFDPNDYTEITILNMGDIMCHNPQLDNAYDYATGEYDFSGNYKYIKDIVSKADYSVVNFEVTLSGKDYGYKGYPVFNAPETLLDSLLDTGFDMMLFANNHCYDYQHHGLIRTQEIFNEKGVDYIGARLSTDEKTYKNVDINGVKVGMINSTDDLSWGNLEKRTVNGIEIQGNDLALMDVFNHSLLDEFYAQAESKIKALKADGADIIVYYIHWGYEYYTAHNEMQGEIAQKLCDLGVDVIIGGHPHVVQDAEMLTSSKDSSHKTLCFYSLGNVVSNQNRLTMGTLDTDGRVDGSYTENGLMVELTIRKYGSGETLVTDVDTIPTWVHRYYNSNTAKMAYDIIPLDAALADPTSYGLYNSSFGLTHATAAIKMTNDTLGGIKEAFAATVSLPTGNNSDD